MRVLVRSLAVPRRVRSVVLVAAMLASACTNFEVASRHVVASVEHPGEGLAIPDNDTVVGLEDTIQIDEDCDVVTVEVEVDIEHELRQDLTIDLEAPDGIVVRLLAADDEEDEGDRDVIETFPGTLDSVGDLIDFADGPGRGEWTLTIKDDGPEDTGTLLFWLLRLGCR